MKAKRLKFKISLNKTNEKNLPPKLDDGINDRVIKVSQIINDNKDLNNCKKKRNFFIKSEKNNKNNINLTYGKNFFLNKYFENIFNPDLSPNIKNDRNNVNKQLKNPSNTIANNDNIPNLDIEEEFYFDDSNESYNYNVYTYLDKRETIKEVNEEMEETFSEKKEKIINEKKNILNNKVGKDIIKEKLFNKNIIKKINKSSKNIIRNERNKKNSINKDKNNNTQKLSNIEKNNNFINTFYNISSQKFYKRINIIKKNNNSKNKFNINNNENRKLDLYQKIKNIFIRNKNNLNKSLKNYSYINNKKLDL